jgi:isopentenyldiphosphate isomerase
MKIPIVNEKDEIIDYKARTDISFEKDIFRTASLWITNSKGEVLLARRKFDKKVDPGKWAEAVGGTVEGDDSYEDTVIREAEEELGIKERSNISRSEAVYYNAMQLLCTMVYSGY